MSRDLSIYVGMGNYVLFRSADEALNSVFLQIKKVNLSSFPGVYIYIYMY